MSDHDQRDQEIADLNKRLEELNQQLAYRQQSGSKGDGFWTGLAENWRDAQEGRPCFIATAAFGTPHEPVVQIFREFRDSVLRTHFLGRCFIALYGIIGPPMAAVIARTCLLRRAVSKILVCLARIIERFMSPKT